MTEREAAIKRFIDAGGVWPPTPAPVTAWVDTGRWRSLCRGCGAPCAPRSPMVRALLHGASMRSTKLAIAAALQADKAVARLVPPTQIYAVERSTIPVLPAVEIIGVTSEKIGDGPLVGHRLSIEITVTHANETGADVLLDGAVRAVRRRLGAAGAWH